VVGLSTNLIGYLGYLLLTHLGLGHTTAMSSLYLLALTLSFVFNRKWAFEFKGDMTHSIFRYFVAHLIGIFSIWESCLSWWTFSDTRISLFKR
jgi:putative flippase GtrA